MNLAYSLKHLGHDPIPFVFTGRDLDEDYQAHLSRLAIDQDGIIKVETANHSSHAFIFTDVKGNQFTGFYPGPTRTEDCLLYTSPSPRDRGCSRMPSSA